MTVWGTRQGTVRSGEYSVVARDSVQNGVLVLDREVAIAAGRVTPADYPAFLRITREAEELLSQPIVLTRKSAGQGAPGAAPPGGASP